MTFRIWAGLFIVFVAYSWLVYTHGDDRNNESAPNKRAIAGWKIWQEKNCQSCHQIYGLGGYLGPDLTNISSDPVKNENYIAVFIKYGTGKMPNFHLDDTDVNDLVAFLKWVDKSGKSKVPKEKVTASGNYNF